MSNVQELWREYTRDRSLETRQALIESYAPLARYVVERLNLRPGPAIEYEDLLSEAVIGLIDAIERFDPSRGIKFETYAYHRIRGAVMDMLRALDWLPRSLRQKETRLADAVTRLEEELGRPPSDDEIAAELGLTLEDVDALAQETAVQAVQSLDEAVQLQGWEKGTIADLIPDESALSPEAEAERGAERELLADAIDALPSPERTVIGLYYHEGLTLREVGRVLGVTESRACQVHGKALVRLRAHIQSLLRMPEPGAANLAGNLTSALART